MRKPRFRLPGIVLAIVTSTSMLGMPAAVAEHDQILPEAGQASSGEPRGIVESTREERLLALEQVEIKNPDPGWIDFDQDRSFLSLLFNKLDYNRWTLTKQAIADAYKGTDDDCTAFIRSGIRETARADTINWVNSENDRIRDNNAKRSAMVLLKIEPTDALLRHGLRGFVMELRRIVPGRHVKDAAQRSLDIGTRAALLQFLEVDVREANAKDTAAEQDAEKMRRAKMAAAAIFNIDDPRYQLLPDREFVFQVMKWSTNKMTRVYGAAMSALGSSDPEVWRRFILVGIHEANSQDIKDELAKQEERARTELRILVVRAENSHIRPALVEAGNAALNGTAEDVFAFLREGQYKHLEQSFEGYHGRWSDNTTGQVFERGYYIRGEGGPVSMSFGDTGSPERRTLGFATWRVVTGLDNDSCYSLESSDRRGFFLRAGNNGRVSLDAHDGSASFKQQATWCSREGHRGEGASLEQHSHPGRFLTRFNGELWSVMKTDQFGVPGNSYVFDAYTTFHASPPRPDVTTPITYVSILRSKSERPFGAPRGDEKLDAGVRFREFEHGKAYSTGRMVPIVNSITGWYVDGQVAFVKRGPILDKFTALGEYRLGFPGNVEDCGDSRGERMMLAAGDQGIYHTPSTGAHLVLGAIGGHWERLGGVRSYLGYPISDEEIVGNIARSRFEHGYIEFNFDTGEVTDSRG